MSGVNAIDLRGKRAVVTGGAEGFGRAIAERFLRSGAAVSLWDINRDLVSATATELSPLGEVQVALADISDHGQVEAAMTQTLQRWPGIDILIANAGLTGPNAPTWEYPVEDWRRVVEVNLVGTFNVIRLAAAAMACNDPNAEGERGVIVNTASVAAFDGQIGQAAYSASKAGVVGMTLPVARELARFGIRCVTIAPGVFETPMVGQIPPDIAEALGKSVPFPPRLGRPAEFASLVLEIVRNVMLNGEVIRLDGAIRMAPK